MIWDLEKENQSLKDVLDQVQEGDLILLADQTYVEKVAVKTKNITMIGKPNTKICFHASHGTLVPKEEGGKRKKVYGTTGSATFTVCKEASGFKAFQITFQNDFVRNGRKNGQAVAFKSETSDVLLQNCRFLGYQDTLYMDGGIRNHIENCYIEGDIDFIFGSADCLFDSCFIVAKTNEAKELYFTAPNTLKTNSSGFVFQNCVFETTEQTVYLGRPWYPSNAVDQTYPKIAFYNCRLKKTILPYLKKMHEQDPTEYSFRLENCTFVGGTDEEK